MVWVNKICTKVKVPVLGHVILIRGILAVLALKCEYILAFGMKYRCWARVRQLIFYFAEDFYEEII